MNDVTRVATLQTTQTMLDYMTSAESKYNKLAEEASSGIAVSTPSDDPIAAKKILKITSTLSELSGYSDNISNASNEIATTSSTLDSVTNSIQSANNYATQAANGTYSSDDLAAIKTSVDQIIQSVVDNSNTNYDGKYIFSGTATSTEPYTITNDPTTGNITAITYNGTTTSDYKRYTTISDGVSVATNLKGNSVFGSYATNSTTTGATTDPDGTTTSIVNNPDGSKTVTTVAVSGGTKTTTVATATGLLGNLVVLSNALGNDDTKTINSCITSLSNDLTTVTAANTKIAAVSNRLDSTSSLINETKTNLKSYKSDLQEADLTQVATDLATQENALKATYSVTSQMLQKTSLLNYL